MTKLLLQDAGEEIKRAEHLLFISLKYTRTRDVMRNIIVRLIAAYDLIILAILESSKSKKKLDEIPESWKTRAQLAYKIKSGCREFLELYSLLRKVYDSPYSAREEFRKHITMVSNIGGKKVEIDVPTLTEYFKKTKMFLKYAEEETE